MVQGVVSDFCLIQSCTRMGSVFYLVLGGEAGP